MSDETILKRLEKPWPHKSLGEIAIGIIEGKEVTKAQLESGDYHAIRYAEIFKHQVFIEECTSKVNPEIIKSPKYCQYGDLLFSKFSENIQETGKSVVYLGSSKPIIGQHIIAIRHNENPKFLQYLMSCEFVKKQIQSLAISSTVFCLYSKHIKKIKIPLPPRHIQDRITDYLDKWTNLEIRLEQELEQELEQRKKQYEYYKESLLNNGMNKWEIVSLDKVANEIVSGKEVTESQLGTGNYPAIKFLSSKSHHSLHECHDFVDLELMKTKIFCEHGDILMIKDNGRKEYIGKAVVYLGNEKPVIGSHVFLLKHKQNGIFLSYILSSEFVRKQIRSQIRGAIINGLTKASFRHIQIPLPSLEEQFRIVETLDKFQAITDGFKNGLPSLIEKHKKQYIYYKERILKPELPIN